MNFIKIKDDYINLDNVNDIRISEHEVFFTFNGPDDETFICYRDNAERLICSYRKLTTEELEQLKWRIHETCSDI